MFKLLSTYLACAKNIVPEDLCGVYVESAGKSSRIKVQSSKVNEVTRDEENAGVLYHFD